MPDRYCPNCGTEVEADARFCPSCGTTLSGPDGGSDIPAAPAWPPPEPSEPEPLDADPVAPALEAQAGMERGFDEALDERTMAVHDEPEPVAAPPPASRAPSMAPEPMAREPMVPVVAQPPPRPAEGDGSAGTGPAADLPFTRPTLLSGWLIGGGAIVGALALIPRLAGPGYLVSMLLFLALLGIAATVFLADHMPEIPRLRLIVLCTTLIGLGVGLARAAFAIEGIDTLFLISMLAAAGGALLIELDRDRAFPPPERSEP